MNQAIQILINNALAHIKRDELLQAKNLLTKARALDSSDPESLRLLAVIAAFEFNFAQALELIDQAIKLNPQSALIQSNRGNILKELGRYEEALDSLNLAIQLNPNYDEAYNNVGNVLQEMHCCANALSWYDKALTINPSYFEAYGSKGNAYEQLGRPDLALECFDRATTINPQYTDGYWMKAMTQLRSGDFEAGWQNYEARWFKSHPVILQFTQIPILVDLRDIGNKKVLIWAEQGFGDTIQFSRYVEYLYDRGAIVTFLVQKPLVSVLKPLEKYCELVSSIEGHSPFDFQSPLLSLPLVFQTRIDSLLFKNPYLFAEAEKITSMRHQLLGIEKLKIGLVWNGGFRADSPELWTINKRRNIELDQIAVLRGVPGVDFYSLQKGDPAESEFIQRKDQVWPEMVNCAPLLNDFSDTAALMTNLDLIISVDTSSAHLAGALGKPVWILNRFDSCWRWLRGREDSPWYPTAKIYQQKSPGDWGEVISRVRLDLANLAKSKMANT